MRRINARKTLTYGIAFSLLLTACTRWTGYTWEGASLPPAADNPVLIIPNDGGAFGGSPDNPPVYTSSFPSYPTVPTYTDPNAWNANVTPKPSIPFSSQSGDYFSLQGSDLAVWDQFPVKIYVEYPEKLSSEAKDALTWAIQAWKQYVPMEVTREKEYAQIQIQWASEIKDGDDTRFGQTKIKSVESGANGRNRLKQVQLKLLLPDKYGGLADRAMKGVFMHELGHALGIKKDSDVDGDVMAEPQVNSNKGKMIRQVVKSLAMKGLESALSSQGINLNLTGSNKTIQPTIRVVETISQRDLNTLYRLYNPPVQTTTAQASTQATVITPPENSAQPIQVYTPPF